jgi:hypothetical protein
MARKNAVYRKSAHGAQALAARDPSLVPRLRSLLILADGRRPAEELAKLCPAGPQTEQLLAQLEALGMVEVTSDGEANAAPAAAPASPSAIQPIAVQPRTVPLAQAQRAAVKRLVDLLGPEADGLCLRIEAVRTAQDLLALLERAETLVRSARGAGAATSFVEYMQDHRPG